MDIFGGVEPACTEEDASCPIEELTCVKTSVVSVPAEGDALYADYQTALETNADLVPGNVSYDCQFDLAIENGSLEGAETASLESYGVVITAEVYEGPAEDFAAKLALSATAALAVASLF